MGLRPGTLKAFYFDRGIHLWATNIESEMDRAEQQIKGSAGFKVAARKRILDKHLEDPAERKYKDPAAPKKPDLNQDVEMVIGGD